MQLEILSQKKGSPESHRSYEINGKTLELLLKAEPTILTCPGDVSDGGSRSKSNESSPCG